MVVGTDGSHLVGRRQVPLADGVRVVTVRSQHFGECAGAFRYAAAKAREPCVPVRYDTHAHRVMVAPGQQARPRR